MRAEARPAKRGGDEMGMDEAQTPTKTKGQTYRGDKYGLGALDKLVLNWNNYHVVSGAQLGIELNDAACKLSCCFV